MSVNATMKLVDNQAPSSMRAWVMEKAGDIAKIDLRRVEIPTPDAGLVRVKVMACATNPIDFKHATFEGMAPFPAVFGCDGAGVVDEVGEGVEGFAKGDRVYFLLGFLGTWGSFAEFTLVKSNLLFRIPEGVSFAAAASLPVAAWTAHEALFDRMRVQPGQSVFIAAGAGGVGHFATQMAKSAGCRVITTASGPNVELLKHRGLEVIDYKEVKSIKDEVMRLTDGKGVDAAFDMLDEAQAIETMQLVKFAGQYTQIAAQAPSLPGGAAFFNALTIHHVVLAFNLERPEFHDLVRKIESETMALVASHKVLPDITKVVPFDALRDALVEQQGGRVRGKIVVSLTTPAELVKDCAFTGSA